MSGPFELLNSIRLAVFQDGVRAWQVKDFPDLDGDAVLDALERLVFDKELVRVDDGFFWRGRKREWGMSLPSPLDLAKAVSGGKGYGFAALSASNELGFTSQVPGTEMVAVPLQVNLAVPELVFVDRSALVSRVELDMNEWEVSLMEVLSDWGSLVDIQEPTAVALLEELFSSQLFSQKKISVAINTEQLILPDKIARTFLTFSSKTDMESL